MLHQWYWIMPNEILYSKELSDKQKLLFCTISSLCAEKGYCRATNETIWGMLNADKSTISRNIAALEEKWYITINVEKNYKRKITLGKNEQGDTQKCVGGDTQKWVDNNTSSKSIKENKIQEFWDRLKQEWFSDELIQVILDFDKKKKKWKMSQMEERYLKKWIKELRTYWENKDELMIEVIEQSIISWRDWLFAVKKQAHYTPRVDAINRH